MNKKRTAAVVAATALVLGSLLATTAPAAADPGFCGVRHAYLPPPQGGGDLVYVVRNQCVTTYNFEVFLPSAGKSTGTCQPVVGGGYGYYASYVADPDWQVRLC
ncbi:hypothetical protein [Fodinicola acaciae]|uniref:hypothetical protein n=1 Tax=Fodinicola acaciae TaxID=2681555 RepID=UPI0013D07EBF|nr:hypothetical protein [Fodinicola acaciae]